VFWLRKQNKSIVVNRDDNGRLFRTESEFLCSDPQTSNNSGVGSLRTSSRRSSDIARTISGHSRSDMPSFGVVNNSRSTDNSARTKAEGRMKMMRSHLNKFVFRPSELEPEPEDCPEDHQFLATTPSII
jgi:hypothetical protein